MTVLICTDYLPPGTGGVEVVVQKLVEHVSERGVETVVAGLSTDDEPSSLSLLDGVRVYELSAVELTDVLGLQSRASISALSGLPTIVRRHDPDVVHVHNRFFFTSVLAGAWKLGTGASVPLVTTLHLGAIGTIDGTSGRLAGVAERLADGLLTRASDAVIGVSDSVAVRGIEAGAPPDRTYVVPNGVDPTRFRPAPHHRRGKRILFVGRLVRNKGPQVLLEALPDVVADHPSATLEIVGTGPMRSKLESMTTALGVDDHVRFSGYVDDVAVAMRRADVFCRPSFSEGMPLTMLEAMASGLPAVVTPVGGVSDVVDDGETGFLVPTDDSASLAGVLSNVLGDRDRAAAVGRRAREYVADKHSWERRGERVLDVYEDVVNSR